MQLTVKSNCQLPVKIRRKKQESEVAVGSVFKDKLGDT